MKKLALLLLFIPLFTRVFSQGDEQVFHFGLKASPVIAWTRVDASGAKNDGIRLGFTYGLITEFRITKNYAFATGVDVSYRGGKYKKTETEIINGELQTAHLEKTQKFQMVEIPLALKLKTNEIGYIKYFGSFGITPGLIVNAKEDIVTDNVNVQVSRSSRGNQSDFLFFNTSLNVGLGIEYSLGGNTAFTTGIHYTNGLIDIWKLKESQMRSDNITLLIGVLF